jgi:hypothetical protein
MIPGMDPRFPTGKFVFDPNPTAQKRRDCIAAIAAFPAELKAAMATARMDQPYREGGWTARQVVHHVADSHMNAFVRFRLALTEDRPTIKPYNETEAKLDDTKLIRRSPRRFSTAFISAGTMLLAMSDADFHARRSILTMARDRSTGSAAICLARPPSHRPSHADGCRLIPFTAFTIRKYPGEDHELQHGHERTVADHRLASARDAHGGLGPPQ